MTWPSLPSWLRRYSGRRPGRRRVVECFLPPRERQRRWWRLQAWLEETGAKRPQPNPDYQEAWAAQQEQAARGLKARLERQHADYLKLDWQPDPTWWKSLTTKD